jgi:hypothetical protein
LTAAARDGRIIVRATDSFNLRVAAPLDFHDPGRVVRAFLLKLFEGVFSDD